MIEYKGKINGGDFPKFCGLLRIYELYNFHEFLSKHSVILVIFSLSDSEYVPKCELYIWLFLKVFGPIVPKT